MNQAGYLLLKAFYLSSLLKYRRLSGNSNYLLSPESYRLYTESCSLQNKFFTI